MLSTCNRTELYAVAGPAGVAPLRAALAARGRLSSEEVAAAGFAHTGPDALAHLFRVTAGLDSLVVGETEIQPQVRRTAAIAHEEGTLGELAEAFRDALATGRRVRRETGVGRGAVSTASVCVELARQALGGIDGRRALVLGAGAMASSAARALARNGTAEIVVANRPRRGRAASRPIVGGRGTGLRRSGRSSSPRTSWSPAPARPRRCSTARRSRAASAARDGAPSSCVDLALAAGRERRSRASAGSSSSTSTTSAWPPRPTAPAARSRPARRGDRRATRSRAACGPRLPRAPLPAAPPEAAAVRLPSLRRAPRTVPPWACSTRSPTPCDCGWSVTSRDHDQRHALQLADAAGVHVNTIRGTSPSLEEADVLASTQKPATGPGRPPTEYRLVGGLGLSSTDFLELAGLLAAALVRSHPDHESVRATGADWGRYLVGRPGRHDVATRSRWRSSGSGSTRMSTARPSGSRAARARSSRPITPRSCAPWRPGLVDGVLAASGSDVRVAEHDANPEARRCTLRLTRSPGLSRAGGAEPGWAALRRAATGRARSPPRPGRCRPRARRRRSRTPRSPSGRGACEPGAFSGSVVACRRVMPFARACSTSSAPSAVPMPRPCHASATANATSAVVGLPRPRTRSGRRR